MSEKDPNSKYLTLWLCVIVSAVIIIGGWVMAMKYNFKKISNEMSQSGNRTSEQATSELEQMFAGVQDILNNSAENDKITEADKKVLDETQAAVQNVDEKIMEKISEKDSITVAPETSQPQQ